MKKLRSAGFSDAFTSIEAGVKEYVQHYLSDSNPYLDTLRASHNA